MGEEDEEDEKAKDEEQDVDEEAAKARRSSWLFIKLTLDSGSFGSRDRSEFFPLFPLRFWQKFTPKNKKFEFKPTNIKFHTGDVKKARIFPRARSYGSISLMIRIILHVSSLFPTESTGPRRFPFPASAAAPKQSKTPPLFLLLDFMGRLGYGYRSLCGAPIQEASAGIPGGEFAVDELLKWLRTFYL